MASPVEVGVQHVLHAGQEHQVHADQEREPMRDLRRHQPEPGLVVGRGVPARDDAEQGEDGHQQLPVEGDRPVGQAGVGDAGQHDAQHEGIGQLPDDGRSVEFPIGFVGVGHF